MEEAAGAQGLIPLPHLVIYPDGAQDLVYDTSSQEWKPRIGDAQSSKPSIPWHEQVVNIVGDVRARAKWRGILVGGCCKSRPMHIAQLKQSLDVQGRTSKHG